MQLAQPQPDWILFRSFYWGAHSLNSLKRLSLIHGLHDHPRSLLRDHLCYLRHHRAGIRRDPWCTGISVIKNSNLRNFPSWSTQMKNDPYHSWKALCFFCVVTGSPIIKTGILRVRISRMYSVATRKEPGALQEWYRSFLAHLSRRLKWAIAVRFRPSCVVRRASSVVRKLFTFSSSSWKRMVGF